VDALDRLARRVSLAMTRDPGREITIGALYQEVVPYRLIRSELGFTELAEYEHALLRLLAGEREYLELDSVEAGDEFRRELEAPNPILGIYRDYAGVGVQANPFAPVPPGDPTAPPMVAGPRPATAQAGVSLPPPPAEEPRRPRPKPCRACRSPLPVEREARFCPSCGACLVPIPCVDCSAMMEPEWGFCISCGARRSVPDGGPEQRLR
jgi:hypothetical protein